MKKILLSIIISSVSLSALASVTFNVKIPQPDFISSDWDNDGLSNKIDDDDDGDGIKDVDDSSHFSKAGRNSTPSLIFNDFTSNKITIDPNESFNLSWSFENPRKLSLYDDLDKNNLISDVTGLNSLSINNVTSDKTFYLDYMTDTASFNIFTWQFNGKSCGSYSPLASTVDSGNSFTQYRTCTNNYVSGQPNSKSINSRESRQSVGTKSITECKISTKHKVQFFNKDNSGNPWVIKVKIQWNSDGPIYEEDRYFGNSDSIRTKASTYKFNINGYTYYANNSTYSTAGYPNRIHSFKVCRKS
jgi:hypothetical protein